MSEPAKPSPQALKKQRRILTQALHVFAKEGFRNADVQIIADLSGVGKGTVYRHFGNKEQLFLATGKFCVEQMSEFVEQQLGGSDQLPVLIEEIGVPALLRKIIRSCAEFYQKHPQAIEIMIQERAEFRETVYPTHLMLREEKRSGLDKIIQAGIDRGELRPTNAKHASDAYADLLFGSMINGCLMGQKTKLVERVDNAIELFLNGLVASEKTTRAK